MIWFSILLIKFGELLVDSFLVSWMVLLMIIGFGIFVVWSSFYIEMCRMV